MLEIGRIRTNHRIAAVIVSHLDRHGPGDLWPIFKPLEALPSHTRPGAADAKNGGHQNLNRITARGHDKVDPRGGVGEAVARTVSQAFDTQDQRNTESDCQDCQSGDNNGKPI